MDSPETAKTTTTTATSTSSDLVPVQDSPIFSYISNLSPLQPLNAVLVAQGFPGLNSPPLVFRSPQINPNLEAGFLKGPRFPLLPSVEIPQNDDKGEKIEADLEIHERAVNRSSSELIKCGEKRCDTKASVQAQPCSSSGCLVKCYTVPHRDSAKSAHSTDSSLKQANAVSQLSKDGCFESTEDFVKLNDDEHSKKKLNMRVGASPALEEQSEDESQGKSASHAKLVEIERKKNCSEKPFINVVYGHASKEQKSEHIVAQYTGGHHQEENECGHQLLLESINMVEGREVCGENAELISIGSLSNMVVHDPEASQHKRGIRRRCLFEEVHPNIVADSPCSSNLSNSSESPATLSNIENTESSFVDATPTSNNRQVVGLHHPEKILFSSCTAGNSSRTVSKPSGIGLHLNSIVSALPLGCGAIARFSAGDKDQLNIQGLKSASQINCQLPENIKSGSISSNIVDNVSACSEDGMHENKGLIAASSAACDSAYGGKNSLSSSMLNPAEDCATPHNKRKIYTEHADNYEDLNQPSPKKKRKKASSTIGGEGCKRCNCRKTKCLKLYCDCFAAGIYCSELCACQGCFNKPEYEDTVFETRQQIESRNPLAFAPKVVQPVSESPAENAERAIQLGLSSARHKRGCNCKRSMCLKKYCECYQGNVGCSDGCRCEGCKNVYGRKEEYGLVKELVNQRASDESLEGTSDDKLDMAATKKGFSCTEIYNLHDLTPLTPLVQYSDVGKEASRTRLLSRRCCPSPESDFTVLSSFGKSPRSPTDSERHDIVLNTSKEILDVASNDRDLFYSSLERRVQSSPSYDGLASIHGGTALPDTSSIATASSASKTRDWTNGSGVQLCPGSSRLSSTGSLRWRSSPITPMTRLGETKVLQGFDSDSGLYGIAGDGTPDILKESTPFKAFKVNSPNRKRVSPPKHTRLHELGSSSSGGLKSGRKFILQAVPSFPSLSPCIETKGCLHQNESDIQDSGNK